MKAGTRMIDGREFSLAGLDSVENAKETAKRYRAHGLMVRIISDVRGSIWRQIWVHGDLRLI